MITPSEPGISVSFPEVIETERLLLTPSRPGEGAEVNAAIRETYEDLHLWMDWADHLPQVEETEEFCRAAHSRFLEGSDFSLRARLKETGTLAVVIGLHPRDGRVPKFEIGYWCRADFQGKGYVTEAVQAVARTAFEALGANRVEIRCDTRNLRSRRVAERVGFRLEVELRNDLRAPGGRLRDTCIYALTSPPHAEQTDNHVVEDETLSVTLREVTADNVQTLCHLTLKPGQEEFVAPNAVSLAEAHYYPVVWVRAIYADETAVGLVLLINDAKQSYYCIWRLMIGAEYQGKGYGQKAVEQVIEYVKGCPNATELLMSYNPGEGNPAKFYRKLGFVETGEIDNGQILMRYLLNSGPPSDKTAREESR